MLSIRIASQEGAIAEDAPVLLGTLGGFACSSNSDCSTVRETGGRLAPPLDVKVSVPKRKAGCPSSCMFYIS